MEGAEILYPEKYECHGHSELSLFKDMIGFEEFNAIDDSAIFDDLQEGTLLSILKDDLFVDLVPYQKGALLDQQEEPCVQQDFDVDKCNEISSSCEGSNKLSACGTMQCHGQPMQVSRKDDSAKQTQMGYRMTRKRMRRGSCQHGLGVKKQLSHMSNPKQLLEFVQHDHCYVASSKSVDTDRKQSGLLRERSSRSTSRESLEEGSNSDAGGIYIYISPTVEPLFCVSSTINQSC